MQDSFLLLAYSQHGCRQGKSAIKAPRESFKLKTALFRQTLLYSSRLKDGECGQMKDVWLRKRQYWVLLYLGAGWEAYDNCSTQGGSCRGLVPGQPPGCRPGERGWSLAAVRLPNLTSLHQTRTKWDFSKGLINWADLGRFWESICLWDGGRSQPCGPESDPAETSQLSG